MAQYGRGAFDYRYDFPPSDRKVPRDYDPPAEYPRQAQRVYAAVPAAVSYPAPASNRRVEVHYYNPDDGLPVPAPIRPMPAPVYAAAPPSVQIQYPQLPSGAGSQFVPGHLYKVVGVEDAQLYRAAPPMPRADFPPYDYGGYGPPQRRPPYGPYY